MKLYDQTKLKALIDAAMTAQASYSREIVRVQFIVGDYPKITQAAHTLNEANQALEQYLQTAEQQNVQRD